MERKRALRDLGLALSILGLLVIGVSLCGGAMAQDTGDEGGGENMGPVGVGLVALGAGIAIAGAGYATGKAQSEIGSAAVGAVAEDPSLFGRLLVLVVIPETIVIFGLYVAYTLMTGTVGNI